jgi:hypothetical protein
LGQANGYGAGSASLCSRGVVAIASGLDTGLLAQVSLASTNGVEQALIDHLHATTKASAAADAAPVMKAGPNMMMAAQQPAVRLPVER